MEVRKYILNTKSCKLLAYQKQIMNMLTVMNCPDFVLTVRLYTERLQTSWLLKWRLSSPVGRLLAFKLEDTVIGFPVLAAVRYPSLF